MDGLLGARPPQPGAAASPPAQEPDADGEQPNVSPEEQASYNRFVGHGMHLIWDKAVAPKLLARIQKAGNPVEGLASTTVAIVSRVEAAAEADGSEVAADVLMHGGIEIMGNIAELAEAAGVHTFTDEEKESALYLALDQYGTQEMKRGKLDSDAIANDFKAMIEADRAEAEIRPSQDLGDVGSGGDVPVLIDVSLSCICRWEDGSFGRVKLTGSPMRRSANPG